MTRTQWAAAGIGVLLLLGTTNPATATTTATTTAATQAAAAPAKKVFRSYGAGPVKLDGPSARIAFTGSKGDIVHLDAGSKAKGSTTTLVHRGRTLSARWDGFWKLPRSGNFSFRFTAVAGEQPGRKLQLQLVRVESVELDGMAVKGRKQPRGYLNAVAVTMGSGERALLEVPDFGLTVLTPDGQATPLLGNRLQLEVGRPLHTTVGAMATGLHPSDLRAGRVLVLSKGGGPTRATRSVVSPIATDGTIEQFTSDNRVREHVFTFDAAAGDVVIPDFHGTQQWDQVLQNPTGRRQEPALTSGAYWLEDTGTVRYSIITDGRSGKTTKLSLSQALKMPTITDLSTPITLSNASPGQYVAAAIDIPPYPDGPPVGLSATDAAFSSTDGSTPSWSVHLEPAQPYYCLAQRDAALGCGEYYPLTVDQSTPTTTMDKLYGFTGNSLVLAVPPTVKGSVTITLQKPTPPPS